MVPRRGLLVARLNSNEPRMSEHSPEYVSLVVTCGLTSPRISCTRRIDVKEASGVAEVLNYMERDEVAALVLGPDLKQPETLNLLQTVTGRFSETRTLVVVFADSPDPAIPGDFIESEKLFYFSRWPLPAHQANALIAAAVARFRAAGQPQLEVVSIDQETSERVLDYSLRLSAQEDPEAVCSPITEAVRSLSGASHAQCLIYDGTTDSFLRPGASDEDEAQSAATGLASYVLRTGEGLCISDLAGDHRFDAELDNPGGAHNP
jgi:hypothetical protein